MPEQLTAASIDHRADVYALGCTLYELLTGAKSFPRTSADAVIAAHLHEPPPRPSATVPQLPRRIDDVIARALAKDRSGAVRAAARRPPTRPPHSAWHPSPRRCAARQVAVPSLSLLPP
ncbi:hypothetical protein AB0I35_24040 [Nocardia sp. NPDC050378]|uniref:hypothetical protein n=1 Tax=Nocardia sp. NPDC050378 TaxID=3155400 RepID=UPI0033D4315C